MNVTELPSHFGPSLFAIGKGRGFIVTLVVVDVEHPPAFVTVNVYNPEAERVEEEIVGFEMDEVNPTFPQTDVVLVVGANDVVNPAAKTDPTAPIYGMPILDVAQAGNVIFLKRSMRPGFAGIENELLYDPKTTLLFGDAKASLTKVVSALKGL